jgi:hypothetical protein
MRCGPNNASDCLAISYSGQLVRTDGVVFTFRSVRLVAHSYNSADAPTVIGRTPIGEGSGARIKVAAITKRSPGGR